MKQGDLQAYLNSSGNSFPIITVRTEQEECYGLLANSIDSLPNQSTKIMLSFKKSLSSVSSCLQSNYFVVNLLSTEQQALAKHFELQWVERFDGLDCELGIGDTPMLRGCAARLECKTLQFYDGGSNHICIGEVLNCEASAQTFQQLHKLIDGLPRNNHDY